MKKFIALLLLVFLSACGDVRSTDQVKRDHLSFATTWLENVNLKIKVLECDDRKITCSFSCGGLVIDADEKTKFVFLNCVEGNDKTNGTCGGTGSCSLSAPLR
jgi:hypothetical protein